MFDYAIPDEQAQDLPPLAVEAVAIASLMPSEHESWDAAIAHVNGECCNFPDEDGPANAAIRDAIAAGQELEPILAHWPSRAVLDGHHRCAISLEAGRDTIPVDWTTDLPE